MSTDPSTLSTTGPEFSTPMMQQYLKLKEQYQDCILLYRLGDFYEMFLDDALVGAEILDITLTSRTRGKDGRIPMAGVPYHAIDNYLFKLIQAGKKVAICEQVSLPGKGLVEREVIRIISPGTFIDERHVERKEHLYIAAVAFAKGMIVCTAIDVSTGEVRVGEVKLAEQLTQKKKSVPSEKELQAALSQIETQLHPAEVILAPSQDLPQLKTAAQQTFRFVQITDDWSSELRVSQQVVRQQFGAATLTHSLFSSPAALQTTAAVLRYLAQTQKTALPHLRPPQELFAANHLKLDHSTLANLEVFECLRSSSQQLAQCPRTLLDVIDQTRTAMGGRLLRQWLRQPLTDIGRINNRLDRVEYFFQHRQFRTQLQDLLRRMIDIERLISRIVLKLGSPKDLRSLVEMLSLVWQTKLLVEEQQTDFFVELPTAIDEKIITLRDLLDSVLVEDPSFDPRQGNIVQPGYNTRLDELRSIVSHSQEWMAALEQEERQKTGISSLKIRFNNVFGFYIEVSRANLDAVPEYFQRKQTLVNAERFVTPELKKHEEIILNAKAETDQIEFEVFQELVTKVEADVQLIQTAVAAVAELDCLAGLAEVAIDRQYTRPTFTAEKNTLDIIHGRHPVVEASTEQRFVPNSVTLASETESSIPQLILLTGPNMAGKSVLMRQVALIVLMAQLGSFVPANRAHLSITDRIFVRSGAADMITAGLSTFMVEMVETAMILQQATSHSLVIMDEIGRGTSTYDGISIAWSVAEALVTGQARPKTLFATHYHELNALATQHPDKIQNMHMGVSQSDENLVFLYTLQPGEASHSYGLEVAKLAGVPQQVIDNAQEILQKLEKSKTTNH